jgi:ubiquinone/menaquinone biosynthesis C-methylase UbiE
MRFLTRFVACAIATAALVAQSGQDTAADVDRLVKALDIHGGSVVGEIGAGDGALTVAIGKTVGDAGRVFSNELSKDRLAAIGKAVDEAGLKNVTTIEGAESETRFTDQCCDAIFMRDVYHHFSDPAAMNASIYRSLKPGGRVAILDFGPPPGGESADPAGRARDGHHGITAPTLERELRAAGFEIVSTIEWPFRSFMIVARRGVESLIPSP